MELARIEAQNGRCPRASKSLQLGRSRASKKGLTSVGSCGTNQACIWHGSAAHFVSCHITLAPICESICLHAGVVRCPLVPELYFISP